jgi:hypothetical protein
VKPETKPQTTSVPVQDVKPGAAPVQETKTQTLVPVQDVKPKTKPQTILTPVHEVIRILQPYVKQEYTQVIDLTIPVITMNPILIPIMSIPVQGIIVEMAKLTEFEPLVSIVLHDYIVDKLDIQQGEGVLIWEEQLPEPEPEPVEEQKPVEEPKPIEIHVVKPTNNDGWEDTEASSSKTKIEPKKVTTSKKGKAVSNRQFKRVTTTNPVETAMLTFGVNKLLSGVINKLWNNTLYAERSKSIQELISAFDDDCFYLKQPDPSIRMLPQDAPYLFIVHLRVNKWEPILEHVLENSHIRSVDQKHVFKAYHEWCVDQGVAVIDNYRSRLIKIWYPPATVGGETFVLERV